MPMLAAASIIGALILVAHIVTLRIVPQLGTELVTLLAGTPFEFSIPRNEIPSKGLQWRNQFRMTSRLNSQTPHLPTS